VDERLQVDKVEAHNVVPQLEAELKEKVHSFSSAFVSLK
jgi:hypothetical protein